MDKVLVGLSERLFKRFPQLKITASIGENKQLFLLEGTKYFLGANA
jgi:hypothetical protein